MSSFGVDTETEAEAPKIGIIGGSGLCTFPELDMVSRRSIDTKYGPPSGDVIIGTLGGTRIAYLPRHGPKHSFPPHKVPYKANLAALKAVGVETVIGTCIAGSLREDLAPGTLVIPDQFVNLTWGRDDSYEADGGSFLHLPMGSPYCSPVRDLIRNAAKTCGCVFVPKGTVAVIQGPRFSTAAESQWLSCNGWDIVNMTQYPECYFARELGLCYGAVAALTDFDVGLHKDLTINSSRMDDVLQVFQDNILKLKRLLTALAGEAPTFSCGCACTAVKAYYEQ